MTKYEILNIKKLFLGIVFVGIILIFILIIPQISVAAQDTTSFIGEVTLPDEVIFNPTGSLSDARIFHTSTLLDNGKVLVAGGRDESVLTSAEIFNPTINDWTITGSMNHERAGHSSTLLQNGKVLVAGGLTWISSQESAELYDPESGSWSITGTLNTYRYHHTATLLNNGKVLIAGGYNGTILDCAEIYDPDTGTWSITGNLSSPRRDHTATLLANGKVLVTGGANSSGDQILPSELYDPGTGIWSITGSMAENRSGHIAQLLNNGKVIVAGNGNYVPELTSVELYNPEIGTWSIAESMNIYQRSYPVANLLNNGKLLLAGGYHLISTENLTSLEIYNPIEDHWVEAGNLNIGRSRASGNLLNDGKVLVVGGFNDGYLDSAEIGTLLPGNTFYGTLTVPSGWINTSSFNIQIIGNSSDALINALAISNNNVDWRSWINTNPGEVITTTWTIGTEGSNKPIYLRLRDINNLEATVVMGTVNLDFTNPSSSMDLLPDYSPTEISLSWNGLDELSGISSFEVQVREGLDGNWINIQSNSSNTTMTYNGIKGNTYFFRTRAIDAAGNIEDWPPDYDTFTIVGSPPIANAGLNQIVNTNELVALDGSTSIDTDGFLPLFYSWEQIQGPSVVLSNDSVVNPTFISPNEPCTLTFSLTVTNSLGLTDPTPDEVTITVVSFFDIYLPIITK